MRNLRGHTKGAGWEMAGAGPGRSEPARGDAPFENQGDQADGEDDTERLWSIAGGVDREGAQLREVRALAGNGRGDPMSGGACDASRCRRA
jgi:hypothetical protein